jgi:hypothetical protein
LTVTLRNIGNNGENIGTIVDQVSAINGIQVDGLRFDK